VKEQLSPEIAGKVTFWGGIGDRSKLVQHYYDTDVFVFPPVCDHGFGLPPVEAMAAGVPCVVTRSGATVETVKNNETGFLVDKNDPAALAQAILALLDSDSMREAMGRAARRRVFEQFTWDMAAQRTLDRYLRLCGVEGPAFCGTLAGGNRERNDEFARRQAQTCLDRTIGTITAVAEGGAVRRQRHGSGSWWRFI